MRLTDLAASIRTDLSRLDRRGRGLAYPRDLRERAVSYYCARRAQGEPQRAIGLELGLPAQTLQKWTSQLGDTGLVRADTPDFEPVEVVEVPPLRRCDGFVVRGPAGLSIEGLDIDALVELIRRLS